MMKLLMMAVVASACATTEATPASDVGVELAAVTLADDCGRPRPPLPAKPATPATPAAVAPADCGTPNCGRRCDQTSMQLKLTAGAGIKPTSIKIKRVELLDAKGKLLEVLTARSPSRWDGNLYVAWDEKLAASDSVSAMYELSSPSWDKLTNGRWNAHTKTFQLRVTVTVGSANKTVDKQSITPVRLPPPVPT